MRLGAANELNECLARQRRQLTEETDKISDKLKQVQESAFNYIKELSTDLETARAHALELQEKLERRAEAVAELQEQNKKMREALEGIVYISPHTREDAVLMHDIAADAVKEE